MRTLSSPCFVRPGPLRIELDSTLLAERRDLFPQLLNGIGGLIEQPAGVSKVQATPVAETRDDVAFVGGFCDDAHFLTPRPSNFRSCGVSFASAAFFCLSVLALAAAAFALLLSASWWSRHQICISRLH